VNKDVTRIKLTTTTTQALCLSCHADHNAADLKGTVHPPAVRDCVKCHDPHQSGNQFQLLKPTSGDKNQNLCLECHTQGLNVPDKGSRHAALDMSCQTCHVTHKVGEHGKQEFDYHLTKASPALCLDCHDAKDASLIKAHQGQPFANANCVQCHDPHQSRSPKLMQAFAHPPFAMNACDTCHKPAANGKVVLTQADSKALCVSCHSEQADQFKKAHLHQPAYGLGCATCHEPHGGTNEHLLRAKGSALCLECHGPEAKAQKLEAEHVLTIFNGTAKLPEDYFQKNKVVILPIKYGLGHPVIGHPVQDVMDPADITKVKNHIDCMTCHQPHASTQPGLLAKDQANNMAFCDTCHKNRLALK
jgi:predicted CXXCH cytochrome family protein